MYISTQKSWIHTFGLKMCHLSVSATGKPFNSNVYTHALREGHGQCRLSLPHMSNCTRALTLAGYTVWRAGHLFLLSVWVPCYTISRMF